MFDADLILTYLGFTIIAIRAIWYQGGKIIRQMNMNGCVTVNILDLYISEINLHLTN